MAVRGAFEINPDKMIDLSKPLHPDDIVAVIIPTPNIAQESDRRFKGIHGRTNGQIEGRDKKAQQGPLTLRMSVIEMAMLEAAAAKLGVKRHHFARQSALSMAEAVLHGDQSSEYPYTRISASGYQRRRTPHVG